MRHPLSFTMRCLILLAVLMALPQLAQAQQGGGAFQSQTQTYPFSASASAGTAVQIAANAGGPTGYGQYLVANTGANGAWVTLAFTSALAAQTIPTGSTPGNAVWLPAGAACTYSGPSQAWFNAQTASSTTTLTVTGGTGTAGCVAQSGGGSGPALTTTANQGTPNTNANGWPVKITDGTNVLGTSANPVNVQVPPATPLPAYIAPNATSAAGIVPVSSAALESNHVIKGSAGNLYSLYVTTSTVAGYVMTFNATTAPADGAVTPVECVYVPASPTTTSIFNGTVPDYYSTGIVAVFSTTGCFTKTASATAFFKARAQ